MSFLSFYFSLLGTIKAQSFIFFISFNQKNELVNYYINFVTITVVKDFELLNIEMVKSNLVIGNNISIDAKFYFKEIYNSILYLIKECCTTVNINLISKLNIPYIKSVTFQFKCFNNNSLFRNVKQNMLIKSIDYEI